MNWRFIPYSVLDGATNMAIDVCLLEQAEHNVPVLRLYGFEPACMTLGLNQKLEAAVIERIRQRGFDVVRRPTGGRAVLHLNDITYSFIATQKGHGRCGVLESSVSAAYKQICAGLQRAFEILGVKTELGASNSAYRHMTDCFMATTNADLHFGGKKLAGSAQLRRRDSVLQHGSIPLKLDQNIVAELLLGEKKMLGERHANLFELIQRTASFNELENALRAGFSEAFNVSFQQEELKDSELEIASDLRDSFQV